MTSRVMLPGGRVRRWTEDTWTLFCQPCPPGHLLDTSSRRIKLMEKCHQINNIWPSGLYTGGGSLWGRAPLLVTEQKIHLTQPWIGWCNSWLHLLKLDFELGILLSRINHFQWYLYSSCLLVTQCLCLYSNSPLGPYFFLRDSTWFWERPLSASTWK